MVERFKRARLKNLVNAMDERDRAHAQLQAAGEITEPGEITSEKIARIAEKVNANGVPHLLSDEQKIYAEAGIRAYEDLVRRGEILDKFDQKRDFRKVVEALHRLQQSGIPVSINVGTSSAAPTAPSARPVSSAPSGIAPSGPSLSTAPTTPVTPPGGPTTPAAPPATPPAGPPPPGGPTPPAAPPAAPPATPPTPPAVPPAAAAAPGAPPAERLPSMPLQSPQERRVLALALKTRGPEEAAKLQKQFSLDRTPEKLRPTAYGANRTRERGRRTSVEHRSNSLDQVEEMLNAEDAYFTKLTAYHKEKGLHKVVGDQLNPFGPSKKLPPEVEVAKSNWIKARADYAGFMQSNVNRRLAENNARDLDGATELNANGTTRLKGKRKGATGELLTSKGKMREDEVRLRYERRFFANEVVLGAEEAQNRARIEALKTRDKKGLEGALEWGLKNFKKATPLIRAMSASALIAGGAAAVAVGAGPLSFVLLGLGATSISAATLSGLSPANSRRKSFFGNLSTITSLAGIFGLLGGKAVGGVHKGLKTQEKADAEIAKRDKFGKKGERINLSDPNALRDLSNRREKAVVTSEVVDTHVRYGRIAGSIAGVAGVAVGGHALASEMSPHGATGTFGPHDTHVPPAAPHPAPPAAVPHAPPAAVPHSPAVPSAPHAAPAGPVAPATPSAPHAAPPSPDSHEHAESIVLDKKHIFDADKGIGHLGEKLAKDFPPGTAQPESVKAFLDKLQANTPGSSALDHEDHASIFGFKFESTDGNSSTLLQPGDRFEYSGGPHGIIELVRAAHGKLPEMRWELVGSKGDISPIDPKIWKMLETHHALAAVPHTTPEQAPQPVSTKGDAAGDARIADLNRDQINGSKHGGGATNGGSRATQPEAVPQTTPTSTPRTPPQTPEQPSPREVAPAHSGGETTPPDSTGPSVEVTPPNVFAKQLEDAQTRLYNPSNYGTSETVERIRLDPVHGLVKDTYVVSADSRGVLSIKSTITNVPKN
jgi:hypothetical protein